MKKLLEYKADFVFNIISVFIWIGVGILNIAIIFTRLDNFNGWSLAEIGLLYGVWSLTFSIYNAFGHGIMDIEGHVVNGTLDTLLTKPLDPLFQIICKRINTMGLGFLSFGIIIVIISIQGLDIYWSFWNMSYLVLTTLTGGLLIFSTYLILASLSFWFIRSSAAIKIGYDVHRFSQYPIDIYGKGIKMILVVLLPYSFTNYYPVSFILGRVDLFYGIISPIVCVMVFLISMLVWKLGLKRYESSG